MFYGVVYNNTTADGVRLLPKFRDLANEGGVYNIAYQPYTAFFFVKALLFV